MGNSVPSEKTRILLPHSTSDDKNKGQGKNGFSMDHMDSEGTNDDAGASPTKDIKGTKAKGLSIFGASSLVVGDVAGSALLALPHAMEAMGYVGILLLPVIGLVCAYTGALLGRCWVIIRDTHEEYRGHVRKPYQVIGSVAFGRWGALFISIMLNFSMFGAGVVYTILASQNIKSVLANMLDVHISFCYLLLIVGCVITPFVWLDSPKDYWGMGLVAAVATMTASVILLCLTVQDSQGPYKDVQVTHSKIGVLSFFEGLGTMFFGFGGHPCFPGIQNDMKDPTQFGRVSFIGITACIFIYMLGAIPAFIVYGDKLTPNVTITITPTPALYVVQILVTCHLVCAVIIIINPVTQELDDLLRVKKTFSWSRVASRTSLMLCVIFVAETVPHFGALLSLIGGSAMFLLAAIVPSIAYVKLRSMFKKPVRLYVKVFLCEIIVLGLITGVIATIGALNAMMGPNTFTYPCYVNITSVDCQAQNS